VLIERSTANYGFVVAALDRLAAFDPTLRGRRTLARIVARRLLPTDLAPLRYAFEELLGEPADAARRLLFDWFFYRQLEAVSWRSGSNGRATLLDAERVGAYVDTCPRGIIVATIHLGDYLEGLRQFRLAAKWTKRVFVIRRTARSAIEDRAFARIASANVDLTVLRAGRGAAATAVRALRRGHVVIVLFDLPDRFGRTIEVELLGKPAHVVRGPAELALLGDADVLPIFTHYDECGVSIVEAAPVIAARPTQRAVRGVRLRDVARQLWRLAEARIRADPAQWANWLDVGEMFAPKGHRDGVAMTSREDDV
jgi:lauroyl/myristoyl acyltransferase